MSGSCEQPQHDKGWVSGVGRSDIHCWKGAEKLVKMNDGGHCQRLSGWANVAVVSMRGPTGLGQN